MAVGKPDCISCGIKNKILDYSTGDSKLNVNDQIVNIFSFAAIVSLIAVIVAWKRPYIICKWMAVSIKLYLWAL